MLYWAPFLDWEVAAACEPTLQCMYKNGEVKTTLIIINIIIIGSIMTRTYCSICYWTPTVITGFHMSVPNGQVILISQTEMQLFFFVLLSVIFELVITGGRWNPWI